LPVNRIPLDCNNLAKREQLQGAKTLHIFSKISEILVAVKENLAPLSHYEKHHCAEGTMEPGL